MGSRAEELLQLSAKLFRSIPHHVNSKRTGERVLMEAMQGPALKSYWPNKVRDVVNFGIRQVSSEVPIDPVLTTAHITRIGQAHVNIPVGLHHVYRENIAEWRRKRGGQIKKGTLSFPVILTIKTCVGDAKVTSSSMGKRK